MYIICERTVTGAAGAKVYRLVIITYSSIFCVHACTECYELSFLQPLGSLRLKQPAVSREFGQDSRITGPTLQKCWIDLNCLIFWSNRKVWFWKSLQTLLFHTLSSETLSMQKQRVKESNKSDSFARWADELHACAPAQMQKNPKECWAAWRWYLYTSRPVSNIWNHGIVRMETLIWGDWLGVPFSSSDNVFLAFNAC